MTDINKLDAGAGAIPINGFEDYVEEIHVRCNDCGEYLWVHPWSQDGDIFVDICSCGMEATK